MTTVNELIMLRSLVHAGGPVASDAGVEVVRRDGAIDHVRVALDRPVEVGELVGAFGGAREMPRQPAGGRRVVFPETRPGDGQRSVTVIGEVDRSGLVSAVVFRPDDFSG